MPVCAICTATVATCVGLSRWLGVDDTISGVWIGGLMVSVVLWTIHFLNKKEIRFKFRNIIVTVLTYFSILYPLFLLKLIGDPLNKSRYFGIDKLIVGVFSGSLIFLFSLGLNSYLKKQNHNKVYFPFQKVVIPVLFLLILSLYFYKTC